MATRDKGMFVCLTFWIVFYLIDCRHSGVFCFTIGNSISESDRSQLIHFIPISAYKIHLDSPRMYQPYLVWLDVPRKCRNDCYFINVIIIIIFLFAMRWIQQVTSVSLNNVWNCLHNATWLYVWTALHMNTTQRHTTASLTSSPTLISRLSTTSSY